MTAEHHDVIVIGSGFGGSVMAYRLAQGGRKVCLLERGKAYPPGAFPRSPYGLKNNFWDPSQGLHGMYNVWSFRHLGALVSAGLGGGSLIYANVLIRKPEKWFVREDLAGGGYESWPVTYSDLERHYDAVEKVIKPQAYPLAHPRYQNLPKTQAMRAAAEKLKARYPGQVEWMLPNLAITFANEQQEPVTGEPIPEPFPNLHGRTRSTCRLCGECDIGCNYGSKNTLDYNYLTLAKRAGAELRTRTEVRSFRPLGDGRYEVSYVQHSDAGKDTSRLPLQTMTCNNLVLSAGALGSTFLMLKNRSHFPGLSDRLGHAMAGNGDILGLALNAHDHATGEGHILDPSFGPVIGSAIRFADRRDGVGSEGNGFYLEDAGYPEFINWLAQTADLGGTLKRALHFALAWVRVRISPNPTSDLSAAISRLMGDSQFTRSSLPLLGMGRDVPDGRATLNEKGHLDLDWSIKRSEAYFERARNLMRETAEAMGAKYDDGPLWRLSRALTVHPLGGCPMGSHPKEGVVDSHGQVFGYPGFYIADGSVLPGPVGPNPALTIAACADRAADALLDAWRAPARRPSTAREAAVGVVPAE